MYGVLLCSFLVFGTGDLGFPHPAEDSAILISIGLLIVYILGFVLLSGFLAMTDAAILSVGYAEVEEMVAQKQWGSKILRRVTQRFTHIVVVIVILTSIVNILGPILIGEEAVTLFGTAAIGIMTAVLTVLSILCAEIIPKSIGTHYAPTVSRFVAPFILASIYCLFPVVLILEKLVNIFKVGKRRIGTEEQIRALARIGGGAGHIRESERELIHRVFILNDRHARDLMTPRRHIAALPDTMTIRQAVAEVSKHAHSRYPVYHRTLNDISGIVMNHDLYDAVAKNHESQPVITVLHEVLFVPATMRADALLTLFRRRHIHLAVVQEQGKTAGIISLEDVLEELVGEIEDERDAGKILT